MKYKKLIVFLTLTLGAAIFCKGIIHMKEFHGFHSVQEVQAAPDKREVKETKESEKIAVVNLDEGVRGEKGQINYAEKLSRFPTMDFEYSSLEAAREGLNTGRYGAYIIIPAVFSQNVESINALPQVSQLEYAVNRSYSRESQYELLYQVLSYIDSLNNRVSYMYVDTILKEFHEAQDYAGRVMENDARDKAALDRIEGQDLIVLTEVPELKMEENPANIPDISEYTKKDASLLDAIREEYTAGVQGIRGSAEVLCAEGRALSERLNNLSAAPTPDLTVDGSGMSIIEKADAILRAELERQSEYMLEKEAIGGYLRKLLENNQRIREELQQAGGQPGQPDGEPEYSGEPSKEPESSGENVEHPEQPGESVDYPEQSGENTNQPEQSGGNANHQEQSGGNANHQEQSGENVDYPEQSVGSVEHPEQSGENVEHPEQPGENTNQPESPGEEPEVPWNPENLLKWLAQEDKEIEDILGEIEKAENLDIEKVVELARAEYAVPFSARAEEAAQTFRQRYEEEKAAIASYNAQLAGFQPQIDDQFISRNVQEMAGNHTGMRDTLLEGSQAYMEYAQRSADSVREYAAELQKNIEDVRRKADQTVADNLKEAKEVKKETSLANQKILGNFASKLPYTRTGRAENARVYQFIVNPLTAQDQLETPEPGGSPGRDGMSAVSRKQKENAPLKQTLSGISEKKKSSKGIVFVAAGVVLIVLIVQIYFFIRRRRYEY